MQKHLLSLLMKREASLRIHFTVFEHQEEDLPKKKEAEPVLVRLQRVSDARHLDDFSLIKTLRARMRTQKKRVAEEEATSKKMGPGIRMLPTTEEDAVSAAHVKFSSKFDKNRKDKRALICAAFFYGTSNSSMSNKKRLELEPLEKENQGTVSSSRHKQNSMTTKPF